MNFFNFKKLLESGVQLEEALNRSGRLTPKRSNELVNKIKSVNIGNVIDVIEELDMLMKREMAGPTTTKVLNALKKGNITIERAKGFSIKGSEDKAMNIVIDYSHNDNLKSYIIDLRLHPVYKTKTKTIGFYILSVKAHEEMDMGRVDFSKQAEGDYGNTYQMPITDIAKHLKSKLSEIGASVYQKESGVLKGLVFETVAGLYELTTNGYLRKKSDDYTKRSQVVKKYPEILSKIDLDKTITDVIVILDRQIKQHKD